MAVANLSSLTTVNSYSSLFRVNRSLRNVCIGLHDLEETGMFDSKHLKTYRGLLRELQAQINCELLQALNEREMQEAAKWGKVRRAWEKWLKGED